MWVFFVGKIFELGYRKCAILMTFQWLVDSAVTYVQIYIKIYLSVKLMAGKVEQGQKNIVTCFKEQVQITQSILHPNYIKHNKTLIPNPDELICNLHWWIDPYWASTGQLFFFFQTVPTPTGLRDQRRFAKINILAFIWGILDYIIELRKKASFSRILTFKPSMKGVFFFTHLAASLPSDNLSCKHVGVHWQGCFV